MELRVTEAKFLYNIYLPMYSSCMYMITAHPAKP